MKKIKVVFLLLIMLLITGCAGTYNLNINEDLSVKEELSVTFANEASNYNKIDNLLQDEVKNQDDYKLYIEGDNLKLNYSHEYTSIEDYLLESILYRQLFDSISYNPDDTSFSISAGNIFNLSNSKLNNSFSIKSLQINVTTPLKVTDENADEVSENTYSWKLDSNTKEKYMYMTVDKENSTLNRGTIILFSVLVIIIIIIAIVILKRLSKTKKI